MGGSFKDWRTVMQSAYDCLAPGGYIEIQDYELPPKSLDGSVKETALERWGELLIEAAKVASRPIGCCESFKEWLENVGFVDIQQQVFVWPTNPWPKGDDEKTLGKWNPILEVGEAGGRCALRTSTRGSQGPFDSRLF